jgi:multiple sugar transport system substrate-binding protein
MNTRNRFTMVSLLVVLAILLASCASATPTPPPATPKTIVVTQIVAGTPQVVTATPPNLSQQPITLIFTIWGSQKHIDMINAQAAEYKKTHPNITVQVQAIDYGDYFTKVSLELTGNDKPDAGWMVDSAALDWAGAGALTDLAPYVKNDPTFDYADISTSALGLWVNGDATYGLPMSTSPFFITYNKDLFAKAGLDTPDKQLAAGNWTWDTLRADAKKIAALGKGIYGYAPMDTLDISTPDNLVSVMRAYGGDFWSDDGKQCLLTQPGSIAGMQLINDMMFVDKSMVPLGENVDFTTGNVGMTLHQLSRLTALSGVAFKWDFVPLPSGPAGYKPTIGQAALVVYSESPHQAAAIDFVKFLGDKDNVAIAAQYFPPARKSVLDAGTIQKLRPDLNPDSINSAIVAGIEQGKVLPSHVNAAKILLAITAVFDQMWAANGKADVTKTMSSACDAMTPFLNK